MKQIYCPCRKEWVALTPEETVRQKLFQYLTKSLNFPISWIVLEKALRQMPHLTLNPENHEIPNRRADLICFAKGIHKEHDLYPLLMIECKAVKLTDSVMNQVIGYNYFVGAYCIAAVNATDIQFGFYDKIKSQYAFISYIPSYDDLLKTYLI